MKKSALVKAAPQSLILRFIPDDADTRDASSPSSYYEEHVIEVFYGDSAGEDSGQKIGMIYAGIVHISRAMNEGVLLADVMSRPDLKPYHAAIIADDQIKDDVVSMPVGDLLIIRGVEILPEYRGQDVSLKAALLAINRLGRGCAAVACQAYPISYGGEGNPITEWVKKVMPTGKQPSKKEVSEKLQHLWGKLGFYLVDKKGAFMVMDLSCVHPTIADIESEHYDTRIKPQEFNSEVEREATFDLLFDEDAVAGNS